MTQSRTQPSPLRTRTLLAALAALGVLFLAVAPAFSRAAPPPRPPAPRWVGSWASAQQVPEPYNSLPPTAMAGATLRQVVHLSIGGPELRIRVSNQFGRAPLRVGAVHVALAEAPGSSAIVAGTDHAVTFGGREEVTIPPGARYWSDACDFAVSPLANLTISIYFTAAPAGETGHPGSRATSYLLAGNHVADASLPGAKTFEHWFQLSGVDVAAPSRGRSDDPARDRDHAAPARAFAVVALGDSITDGHASTTNGNDRWPDDLAADLQANAPTREVGVLNAGIGGNRVLLYGLGPDLVARFNRDVLAQSGVRAFILLEGINDIGVLNRDPNATRADHAALVRQVITAFRQIVARARARGVEAIGATILPDGGSGYYHPGAASESDRAKINAWIRAPGHFDAVVDWDQLMRDPAHPDQLLPAYDSGDHLHPNPAGYRAMAAAVPLSLFAPRGRRGRRGHRGRGGMMMGARP